MERMRSGFGVGDAEGQWREGMRLEDRGEIAVEFQNKKINLIRQKSYLPL